MTVARWLQILFAFALLFAGPLVYVVVGGQARAAREAKAMEFAALDAEARRELGDGGILTPPSAADVAKLGAEIEARVAQRRAVLDALFAPFAATPPDDAELRTLAVTAGLDPALSAAVIAVAGERDAAARRHVLRSLFRAVDDAGEARIVDLRLARESAPLAPPSGLMAQRVELTARGSLSDLSALVEHLVAARDGLPSGDVAALALAPTPIDPDSTGDRQGESPPLELKLALDYPLGAER
jgi:hypothetical protein